MKARVFLILCALSCIFTLNAVDHSAKLDALKAVEAKGIENPDLFNDIGLANYHLNRPAQANLYFLKALNLNSAHREAAHNLDFVCRLSRDRELYPQRQFLETFFYGKYDFFNLNRAAIAALIMLLLSALCLHWLMHCDPDKERGLPTLLLIISLLFLLFFSGLTATKAYRMSHNNKAVVKSDNTALYSRPERTARSSIVVNEALVVLIGEHQADWSRIILPDGSSHWVPSSALLAVR